MDVEYLWPPYICFPWSILQTYTRLVAGIANYDPFRRSANSSGVECNLFFCGRSSTKRKSAAMGPQQSRIEQVPMAQSLIYRKTQLHSSPESTTRFVEVLHICNPYALRSVNCALSASRSLASSSAASASSVARSSSSSSLTFFAFLCVVALSLGEASKV